MKRLIAEQDLDDLLVGLGIFGTGGGGDPEGWGRSVFRADQAAGRHYTLVDVADVADDAFVLSGGYLGSVAEDTALNRVVEGWEDSFELERAIRALEAEHGKRADYLIPFELGGGNTPVILSCASRLGIGTIDGDGVGRAAPETQMCSFLGHGISLTPMPLVGQGGMELVVRSGDLFLADEVGRFVASRNGGLLANAHYGMTGKELKRCAVRGSITRSLELGRFVRACGEAGSDGLDAVMNHLGGFSVLHGRVQSVRSQSSLGFYVILATLEGVGRDQGRRLELTIKNEVMCVKEDGRPLVVFPDLALLMHPESLHGVMTPELTAGKEVLLGALPCDPVVREALVHPSGERGFSSARYGENLTYIPVERLMASGNDDA
jgi:uncharacterized protein